MMESLKKLPLFYWINAVDTINGTIMLGVGVAAYGNNPEQD